MIDQMRSALGHATAAATRTHRPPLARERHKGVQPTSATVKAGKSTSEKTAAQIPAKLLLDKPRQPSPVVGADRVGTKRSEVVSHDLIQHALGGRSWGVRGRGTHAPAVAKGGPQRPPRDRRGISRDPRRDDRAGAQFLRTVVAATLAESARYPGRALDSGERQPVRLTRVIGVDGAVRIAVRL